MMHFVNFAKRNKTLTLFNLVTKANYSRRSDKNISSYKIVKSNREPLDDIDNTSFGTNANWELLTPRGFRFYLPGSIGPGWLSSSTTSQVNIHLVNIENEDKQGDFNENPVENNRRSEQSPPMLQCIAQECPMLLRKSIEELFPGSLDLNNMHLTIVTISQNTNLKNMRWSKEVETEKLAKYFVLGASDICMKLKMVGYWADFINPFSGQPYMSPFKSNTLYETDERFRCLGFKIEQKNNCKIISSDSNQKNFVGSLYTTAPASTEFLRELLNDFNKN